MGRKASRWTNLPLGMRARERGKKIHYYLDTGGRPRKEIPLGSDYVAAVKKWADLTSEKKPVGTEYTFIDLVREYRKKIIPSKKPDGQKDNENSLINLLKFFGKPPAPLVSIEPVHIRQYLDWRVEEAKRAASAKNVERTKKGIPIIPIPPKHGEVRANREKALFSHMWNFAREHGYTGKPNPCLGVRAYKEVGRDVVIGDDMMSRIMLHASPSLRFAIRLAGLTGQRPADVLRMSESHIADGYLHVQQGKTEAKLRIEIVGSLKILLDEMRTFKSRFKVRSMSLLINETGSPLTKGMLRDRFDDAREAAGIEKADFKFMDLRATAATAIDDASGIKDAQALLGHATEAMTAHYIRHKVGKKVKPAN